MRGLLVVTLFVLAAAAWASAQSDTSAPARNLHFQSAQDFEQRGEMDKAIHEYEEAIKETPNHGDSHYNLARLLAAKRDYDGAIRQYREALRIKPSDPDFHNNLGLAFKKKGDLEAATSEYREALRLN